MFVNTEPGDYILTAIKEGVVLESVKLKCRPGVLANASPPHALQVLEYLEQRAWAAGPVGGSWFGPANFAPHAAKAA